VYTRYSKTALVWAVAFFVSLVVLNNLADYGTNYAFVEHVLKMDTVFGQNRGSWRAIGSTLLYHVVYCLIILVETVVAVLCWLGGFYLFMSRHDPARFNRAKWVAITGLTGC
jgi:predicted small integral membrane protein